MLVVGLPRLSSMITPAQRHHSAVRVHTRCFWIGSALPRRCSASDRQTERRQPAQYPHSGIGHAHARSGRSVLNAGARADCPGRPHRTDRAHYAVRSRQAFRNITREGTGTSTDLHLADGLADGGYMSRASGPRCAWPHVQIYRAAESARDTVWPVA